ncbi:MAG: T9SS type A sorting domain-containing protein [Sphingobacteriaceae bacterium]|nr:T9SS type A sorting domain-containing protein [Sphingobacteriaceae bacterium]
MNGISYYRLKQFDTDGSFHFSNIISINVIKEKNVKFIVYPNPNKGEFTADISGIENNHEVQISLRDEKGATVYDSKFFIQDDNSNKLNIVPESKLPNGLYICTLTLEGIDYHVKVIVN